MELEALEILRKNSHKRIDEICDLEMDLLDTQLEKLLKKSEIIYELQLLYGIDWKKYYLMFQLIKSSQDDILMSHRMIINDISEYPIGDPNKKYQWDLLSSSKSNQ